jgi:hypothetical protein
MHPDTQTISQTAEQASRLQKLYAAVVLAAIDDAIKDEKASGRGAENIARWANSRDGREVLLKAGIEPGSRAVSGLCRFVRGGKPTSQALSRENAARARAIPA